VVTLDADEGAVGVSAGGVLIWRWTSCHALAQSWFEVLRASLAAIRRAIVWYTGAVVFDAVFKGRPTILRAVLSAVAIGYWVVLHRLALFKA
jgi:hypothetical protein